MKAITNAGFAGAGEDLVGNYAATIGQQLRRTLVRLVILLNNVRVALQVLMGYYIRGGIFAYFSVNIDYLALFVDGGEDCRNAQYLLRIEVLMITKYLENL